MDRRVNAYIPLQSVASLCEASATRKAAALYKKKILENKGRKRLIRVVAINLACMLAVALPFLLIQSNRQDPEPMPTYYVMEMEQQSPLSADNGGSINSETITPETVSVNANTIREVNNAMEQMLVSGNFGDLASDAIQPKTESDYLPILQQRLMDLHYLDRDEPTTYYGAATETAVAEFQLQHGLPVSGVATYQTLTLLFSEAAETKIIAVGQEGQYITNIQERLSQLGYTVPVDGAFGEKTAAAVHTFQQQNSLEETGSLDQQAEELLFADMVICANGEKFEDSSRKEPQTLNVAAMIEIAYEQLGSRYVRGGRAPGGFDCSGLVYYCLRQSGYDLNFLTSSGWRSSKYERIASMKDLQVGDICTFDGHVGIYIGYGKMIDASSSEGIVRLSSDITHNSYWISNWKGARRLA